MPSEEDLLAEIDRLADDESPPTSTEMNVDGSFSASTYQNQFGSWNAALGAAGYLPNREVNISTERLVTEIDRLADDESPPTQNEMHKDGKFLSRFEYLKPARSR